MSDPLKDRGVEDVLSSIRRLVSEETRPADEKPEPEASDRLVLTPALRVAQPPEDTAPEDPPGGDAVAEPATQDGTAGTPEDAAMAAAETAFAPEPADPPPDAKTEADADTFIIEVGLRKHAHELAPKGRPDAAGDEPAPDAEVAAEGADDVPGGDDAPDVAEAGTPDVEAEAPPDSLAAQGAGLDEPADDAATPRHSLSAKIAELEAVIARREDQWDPDQPGAGPNAGTDAAADMTWVDAADTAQDAPDEAARTENWVDLRADAAAPPEDPEDAPVRIPAAEPQPTQEPKSHDAAAPVQDAPDAAEQDILTGDVDVLDEEALRDLVAEIVREELQGALGERITRNVRKLVRREIHRALAAQELD